MTLKVYYDRDIDESALHGRTIAVIGYGAQGRSHALNLRDSGCDVIIGQRAGAGHQRASADGFHPVDVSDAARRASVVCLMLPDEVHGPVFRDQIAGQLAEGDTILCCHGFSLLYEQVSPPQGVDSVLVAPKGAGHMVRTAYQNGSGVPCYVALGPGARPDSWNTALAYARAIGGGRVGVMKTTVREETETDLFGEQAVLCGGVSHLTVAAYETLVNAGYQPEMAYFECVHELKLVVDLIYQGGLEFMRQHISNTAEYGDYTRGPRVIDQQVKDHLQQILSEIQTGEFAKQWLSEIQSGGQNFEGLRRQHIGAPIQQTSRRVHRILHGQTLESPDKV